MQLCRNSSGGRLLPGGAPFSSLDFASPVSSCLLTTAVDDTTAAVDGGVDWVLGLPSGWKLGVPHSRGFAAEGRRRGCVAMRQTLPIRSPVRRTTAVKITHAPPLL